MRQGEAKTAGYGEIRFTSEAVHLASLCLTLPHPVTLKVSHPEHASESTRECFQPGFKLCLHALELLLDRCDPGPKLNCRGLGLGPGLFDLPADQRVDLGPHASLGRPQLLPQDAANPVGYCLIDVRVDGKPGRLERAAEFGGDDGEGPKVDAEIGTRQ